MKRSLLPAAALAVLLAAPVFGAEGPASAVRIIINSRNYDFYSPWQSSGSRTAEATGSVLPGNLLLTVAWPLQDHTLVQVTKNGQSRRTPAEVVLKDYPSNLALLRVDDPRFFDDLEPVKIRKPGPVEGACLIAGWDRAGRPRTYRAEAQYTDLHRYYSQGVAVRHRVSTDLTSGGSGEPVFQDGELVGIVDAVDSAEKTADVIAVDSLDRLLADRADGRYEGQPFFDLLDSPLGGDVNLRAWLGLGEDEGGVYVADVPTALRTDGGLSPGDVILEVDGHPVDDEGFYESPTYGKLRYDEILCLRHSVGDKVPFRILRRGRRETVHVTLPPITKDSFLVDPLPPDGPPSYLVWGGMLFTELTYGYLRTWGDDWEHRADERMVMRYWYDELFPTPARRRVVVLVKVFAVEENAGYHPYTNRVISDCNGSPVRDLAHLKELLWGGASPYERLELEGGGEIVLERSRAAAADAKMAERYGVRRPTNLP